MRISYSALDTFQNCPMRYKFQYIDRLKAPKSKEAVFGTIIHESLKMFHEPSAPTPLSEEDLLKTFTEKWNPDVYKNSQEEAFAFHQGVEILKNYYLQNRSFEFNIINLEIPFEVRIAPTANKNDFHQITGRIDRIDKLKDGSFEIIDYKTTKKMPDQKKINDDFQLSIYHLGLINRWPTLKDKPIKLTLYYLKHGEKLSTKRNNNQLEETKEKILFLIDEIQKSDFPPKPSPLCDWCSYQPQCPMFKHKFSQEQTLVNNGQIPSIIKEYFITKDRQGQDTRRMAELKKLINQYCDEQKIERIFGDEGYITRLAQQRFEYDFEKIKEILAPLGKWDEILNINIVKLRKITTQLPHSLRQKVEQNKKIAREFKVITANKTTK